MLKHFLVNWEKLLKLLPTDLMNLFKFKKNFIFWKNSDKNMTIEGKINLIEFIRYFSFYSFQNEPL